MTRNELAILIAQVGLSGAINVGIFDNLLADHSSLTSGSSSTASASTPLQREIAIFGDSRTAMCHTIAATAFATENYGYAFWACATSGVAFCPYTNNFGVGGDTTAQMLARIAPVVASTAQIVLFMGGTNDRTGGMTVADTKRNITSIVRRLQKSGKIVIVGNDTPRFGAKALTTQQQADHIAIRDWITNDLSKITPVVDTYSLITPADLNDELHPNVKGAAKLGALAFGPALKKYLSVPVDLPTEALDAYSATSTTGSLITNPLLTGSVSLSTSSINPVANSVIATGYKSAGSSFTGVTTKWTKEVAAFGEAQVIQFGGTATAGAYITFTPTAVFPLANVSVGQSLSLMAGFEIVGDGAGILGVVAELLVTKPVSGTSTTIYYRDGDKYQEPFGMPANVSGSLDTQRYVFDGTETLIVPRIAIYLAAGAQTATVKLKQMVVRKHIA